MDLKNRKIRIFGKILFVLYVAFLLYFLLFSEIYGRTGTRMEYSYNLELFKEIKRFWNHRDILGAYVVTMNLLGNVVIFIPFGFFLPMASGYKSFITTFLYSFLVSLGIESLQLVTRIGSFDVDDLLLNTLGGCIGYIIFSIFIKSRIRYGASKKTKR